MSDLTEAQKKQVIDFVRQKSFRQERTILNFMCARFEQAFDSAYELARLVEDGPLDWFGPSEEKVGTDRYMETQLKYRYNPDKEKTNEKLRDARH